MRALLVSAASILAASCGWRADDPRYESEPVIVQGFFYAGGIEISPRISVGIESDEVCVTGGSQIAPDLQVGDGAKFVVLEGHFSQRGSFSHLGQCNRLFRVARIVEVRDPTPTELNSMRLAYEARRRIEEEACPGGVPTEAARHCPTSAN